MKKTVAAKKTRKAKALAAAAPAVVAVPWMPPTPQPPKYGHAITPLRGHMHVGIAPFAHERS